MKKILKLIYSILVYLIIALILYVVVKVVYGAVTKTYPKLFNHYVFIVETESMQGTIDAGTLVFVDDVSIDNVKQDDIIAFRCIDPNEVIYGSSIIHRAIDISDEGITTKGDANGSKDNLKVTEDNFIGIVSGKSVLFGKAYNFVRSTYFIVYLIISLVVLNIAIYAIRIIFKCKDEVRKEQEKERIKKELLEELGKGE